MAVFEENQKALRNILNLKALAYFSSTLYFKDHEFMKYVSIYEIFLYILKGRLYIVLKKGSTLI